MKSFLFLHRGCYFFLKSGVCVIYSKRNVLRKTCTGQFAMKELFNFFFSIQMVYMRSEVHFLCSFSMPKLTYLKELLLTDISGKRKRVQQILSFSFKCFRSLIDNYYHTFRILLLFFFSFLIQETQKPRLKPCFSNITSSLQVFCFLLLPLRLLKEFSDFF